LQLGGQLQRDFGTGPSAGANRALGRALTCIRDLAHEMVRQPAPEVSSAGLGLLVSTALLSGSVQAVLEVVQLLLSKGDGRALPRRAVEAVAKLFEQLPEHGFSIQHKKVRICA
jgi:hypothetical protein